MSYTNYHQIVQDFNYMNKLTPSQLYHYNPYAEPEDVIKNSIITKIRNIWKEHINERFTNAKGPLGTFLASYPLTFRELCCLIELIETSNDESDFEKENMIKVVDDPFRKHNVRFESSRLRKHGLVFRIINPLRPLRMVYEVSFRAQLGITGQGYTDEYEQLDLMLEEESKRNSPEQLDSLYRFITPLVSFNDLIVNDKVREHLRAAIAREQGKQTMLKEWGLDRTILYGRGTTLNFRGPPGTGKTLAAGVIATELGRKLLMVRYDQLQSSFISVTEKHIHQVFDIARMKDAVLFFDEADAIALSRASLDRSWEMSQVNTLLKELEMFEGVCIFATNFAEKYDPAFQRRLTMHIDFPLPTKEQAEMILNKLLPRRAREKGLSLHGLKVAGMSGGDLKNVVLNAAGFALKGKAKSIGRKHLEEAIGVTMMKNKTVGYIQ
ncbi:AAA family ATPase [Candidatus Woesearchaeota archaeon]|nr:MAG: ATPase AAA [archaeon GW2011_AR4]MBS3129679.1 AAA family ATPase [Candidatus Woesearchaeota archaeon]HIH38783.1 ATP-binding protein [Candidatus Woesearchaeota archaeon]HIH49199.1 ATP-binding protein [Candidatus Woesearchaeota archaeon]HIJ03341.1 ATP-binding protein [Candidatus Woesearchaeota archaeon]